MYNYGIGGNEVQKTTGEGISNIPANKTLLVQKLTNESPVSPEIVPNLQTVEQVFEYFKPSVEVSFEDEQGNTVPEKIDFKNIGDFSPKSIKKSSSFLNKLDTQKEQNIKIVKQLATNRALKKALESEQTKQAFIDVLQNAIKEINKEA